MQCWAKNMLSKRRARVKFQGAVKRLTLMEDGLFTVHHVSCVLYVAGGRVSCVRCQMPGVSDLLGNP